MAPVQSKIQVYDSMEHFEDAEGSKDAAAFFLPVDEKLLVADDAPEALDYVYIDLFRPIQPNKLGEKVNFVLRVHNDGDEVLPAGVSFCVSNSYYREARTTLKEPLQPGQVALVTITTQPETTARIKNFQENIDVVIKQQGIRKELARQAFRLNMRDFVGRLSDFKHSGRMNLNIYIVGGQGAGKSALVNSFISLVTYDEELTVLVKEANIGGHCTTVRTRVDPTLYLGGEGFNIDFRFFDTVGVDREKAYQPGEFKAQLMGYKFRLDGSVAAASEEDHDAEKEVDPDTKAHAVLFLVTPSQLRDGEWIEELREMYKEALSANTTPLVLLSHVDADVPEVIDSPITAKSQGIIAELVQELHNRLGVPKQLVHVSVPNAALKTAERHFGIELNLYDILESALRVAKTRTVTEIGSGGGGVAHAAAAVAGSGRNTGVGSGGSSRGRAASASVASPVKAQAGGQPSPAASGNTRTRLSLADCQLLAEAERVRAAAEAARRSTRPFAPASPPSPSPSPAASSNNYYNPHSTPAEPIVTNKDAGGRTGDSSGSGGVGSGGHVEGRDTGSSTSSADDAIDEDDAVLVSSARVRRSYGATLNA